MTQNEKLAEMIFDSGMLENKSRSEIVANELISKGVVFPLCKPGDTVYLLLKMPSGKYDIVVAQCISYYATSNIERWTIYTERTELDNTLEFNREDFGETVFLDITEAARKAKEYVR